MKYYCPECKSEIDTEFIDLLQCPICQGYSIGRLPDFETPSLYEKRTGKKWNGAVWWRWKKKSRKKWEAWRTIDNIKEVDDPNDQILCANTPEPPPEDYNILQEKGIIMSKKERDQQYRENNRERLREKSRAEYNKNKEKINYKRKEKYHETNMKILVAKIYSPQGHDLYQVGKYGIISIEYTACPYQTELEIKYDDNSIKRVGTTDYVLEGVEA